MITLHDLLPVDVALPILTPDPCGPSMSVQVLVLRRWGDFSVAHLQWWGWEPQDPPTWIEAGQDGYDITDSVVAWTNLPAKGL